MFDNFLIVPGSLKNDIAENVGKTTARIPSGSCTEKQHLAVLLSGLC